MTNKHGNTKHGHTVGGKWTPTYMAWASMNLRCYSSSQKSYDRYGGRGIVVCERWRHSFPNFLKDMGECKAGLTLERNDNNGNYEPSNCRWATRKEQANNRSPRYDRVLLKFEGEELTLREWAKKLSLKIPTVESRHRRGWTAEEILSTAVRDYRTAGR